MNTRSSGGGWGTGSGKTKGGKGSQVMVVANGHGLPRGLYVASARPRESKLVDATLATVRVPQRRGRPNESLTTGDSRPDDFLLSLPRRGPVHEGMLEAVLPKLWHTHHAKPTEFPRLARLQAVFALKVTHTVEYVLAFTLGPISKSGVLVHFEGRRREMYTNRSATVIRVAGKCSLPVRV